MAIAPINCTLQRTNRNIEFAGKVRKENNNHSSSPKASVLKTIPLATLLAMSPLNATNSVRAAATNLNNNNIELVESSTNSAQQKLLQNRGKTLFTKEHSWEEDKNGISSQIEVYDIGNSQKPVHMIAARVHSLDDDLFGTGALEGDIMYLANVKLKLVGDDGVPYDMISFKQTVIRDKNNNNLLMAVSSDPLAATVESIINNPKYKTLAKVVDIEREVSMTCDEGLNSKPVDTSWMKKWSEDNIQYGKPIDVTMIHGTNNRYILTIYDTDGDETTYEALSLERSGVPRMKVDAIKSHNLSMENYGPIGQTTYEQVNLSHPKAGKHVIADEKLIQVLKSLIGTEMFNNAYKLESADDDKFVAGNGIIYKNE